MAWERVESSFRMSRNMSVGEKAAIEIKNKLST